MSAITEIFKANLLDTFDGETASGWTYQDYADETKRAIDDVFDTMTQLRVWTSIGMVHAKLIDVSDDGETLTVYSTEDCWQGPRVFTIHRDEVRPMCECGNPSNLCHPDA